jgi:hypothetical protein
MVIDIIGSGKPARGDVTAFNHPGNPVKSIIAGGDNLIAAVDNTNNIAIIIIFADFIVVRIGNTSPLALRWKAGFATIQVIGWDDKQTLLKHYITVIITQQTIKKSHNNLAKLKNVSFYKWHILDREN